MKLSGRFVFVFQWIAPVVLIGWVLFGRGLLGAPLGWLAAIGLFLSPVALLALYIPPVLVLFDREARMSARTRQGYEIASYTLWGVLVVMGIVIVDGGDAGPVGSLLTMWTGMDAGGGEVFLVPVMLLAVVALAAQLVMAVVGIVAARKTAPVAAR